MKLRYLTLFLTFSILLAIWAGRTQLAELVISSSMKSAGLTNVTTDIEQLDSRQSMLSRLEFSLINKSSVFQLQAYNINLSYNLKQLSNGRIINVTIKKLALHHETTRKTQDGTLATSESLEPLKIILALRHALREYVIFDTFSVQHITINGEAFGVLQEKPLRFNSKNESGALFAELSFLDQSSLEKKNNLRQFIITKLTENALNAELRFSATPEITAANLELNISDTAISGNYHINPSLTQDWLQPVADIKSFSEIENISGTLAFNFDKENQITSTVTAKTDKLIYQSYKLDNFAINLVISNATSNPFQQSTIQNGSYINFDNFKYGNFTLTKTHVNIAGELTTANDNWNYKADFKSNSLTAAYQSQVIQLEDIVAGIIADPEKLKINGNFSPATLPGQFAFTLDNDFTKKQGHLAITQSEPVNLNADNGKLSQLFTPWPYSFDLLAGNLILASHAAWSKNDEFRLTAMINIEDAGGNYNEFLLSGLSLTHELEILPELHSISAGKINLKHLDSGIIISNISTNLNVKTVSTGTKPQLSVQDLYGELFGGSFSADDFVFDLNQNKNNFKIKAKNIDLAKIVETQQLEDILITGRVDGIIPVEINEQGIFIEDGALINDVRAGTIRYNPGTGTEQLKKNPLTGIALDALKDFRYSQLTAGVNFTPEGTLTVDLKLKGTSPELDTDRPVHLNINTEQNLIALLKSLRFSQGISENIDKKVRHQYEKTKSKN